MRVMSYSEARNSLKSVIDGVIEDADITVINRRDGGDAVAISLWNFPRTVTTVLPIRVLTMSAKKQKKLRKEK